VFRDLSVRTKLIAVLALPVSVMLLLVALQLESSISDDRRSDRLRGITGVSANGLALVHQLQRERDLSVPAVASGRTGEVVQLQRQRGAVDGAVQRFRDSLADLDRQVYRPALQQQLGEAERRVRSDLDLQRVAVDNRTLPALAVSDAYSEIVKNLLDFAAEVPAEAVDAAQTRDLTTVVALARAKEVTSQVRGLVLGMLAAQAVRDDETARLVSLIGAGQAWNSQFQTFATDPQRQRLAAALADPQARKADAVRAQTLTANGRVELHTDPAQWQAALNLTVDRQRDVEQGLVADLQQRIDETSAASARRAVSSIVLLLLVLAVSAGFSLAMSQSMVKALRHLRQTARDVAERRLPALVERLQRAEEPVELRPRGELAPSASKAKDEIGEVADTFGAVYHVAVDVATEQAAMRRSVGYMFLTFARRSQKLIGQQLELIAELRNLRRDRDEAGEFFRLHHLATRMQRNAENLVVLSDVGPPRQWSEPIPLVDVIFAGLNGIEDADRVELVELHELGVAGHVADDVAHLIAELVENAVAFSPPTTKVRIAGQAVAKGYVVEIEDTGIGMADKELIAANELIANPAAIDLSLSSRLGLVVVGRLAARRGIAVQLRRSWQGGVVALVMLPDQLVTLPPEPPGPARHDGAQAEVRQRPPVFEGASGRGPDDVRRTLSDYRTGLQRGRDDSRTSRS
jgi:signal transduction histidine kinase